MIYRGDYWDEKTGKLPRNLTEYVNEAYIIFSKIMQKHIVLVKVLMIIDKVILLLPGSIMNFSNNN